MACQNKILNYQHQRGEVSLYLLVFIPVMLVVSVFAIDFAQWFSARTRLESEVDRIALLGARYLPDESQARSVALAEIRSGLGDAIAEQASVSVNYGCVITVSLRATIDHSFASLLSSLSAKDIKPLSVSAESSAQLVPSDIVIAVSDGQTLRPGLRADVGSGPEDVWGDSSTWPASTYFEHTEFAPRPGLPGESWRWWDDSRFPRWATQSCFNPALSAIKQATLSLIDNIDGVGFNRLSLLWSPGNDPALGFSVAREIDGAPGGYVAKDSKVRSRWTDKEDLNFDLGDSSCVLFSEPTSTRSNLYALPLAPTGIPDLSASCPSPIVDFFPGSIHDPYHTIAQCYMKDQLLIREALYWRSASLSGDFNIKAVLNKAVQELSSGTGSTDAQASLAGNLSRNPLRKVIILTSAISPLDEETKELVTKLTEVLNGGEVVIAIFAHPWLTEADELIAKAEMYREFFAAINAQSQKSLASLSVARSGEDLLGKIIPNIVAKGKIVSLRRAD